MYISMQMLIYFHGPLPFSMPRTGSPPPNCAARLDILALPIAMAPVSSEGIGAAWQSQRFPWENMGKPWENGGKSKKTLGKLRENGG